MWPTPTTTAAEEEEGKQKEEDVVVEEEAEEDKEEDEEDKEEGKPVPAVAVTEQKGKQKGAVEDRAERMKCRRRHART